MNRLNGFEFCATFAVTRSVGRFHLQRGDILVVSKNDLDKPEVASITAATVTDQCWLDRKRKVVEQILEELGAVRVEEAARDWHHRARQWTAVEVRQNFQPSMSLPAGAICEP